MNGLGAPSAKSPNEGEANGTGEVGVRDDPKPVSVTSARRAAVRVPAVTDARRRLEGAAQDVPDYSTVDPEEIEDAVDVFVDAPVVKVDEIKFELDDLQADPALLAEAGHFVQLNAGAAARLGKVELDIQGVETQALLEVRLGEVTKIADASSRPDPRSQPRAA